MSNGDGLPKGWRPAVAKDLFSFVTSGSRGWAKYYSEQGPLFLRVGNLDHLSISLDLTNVQRVNVPDGPEASRTRVQPGDLLISVTADVGMVGLVPQAFEEAYVNQHVAIARPKKDVFASYVAWYLASPSDGQRQFQALQRGATKAGLGLDDIRAARVLLPPLNEQRRIVAKIEELFSDLDAGVAALRRAKANLKRYRAAVLKAAVEGRLTAQWRKQQVEAASRRLKKQRQRDGEVAAKRQGEANPTRRDAASTCETGPRLLERILQERRRKWEEAQLATFAKGGKTPPANWKSKYKEPAPPDTTDLPELPEGWCWASPDQLASTDTHSLAIGPFGSNLKLSDYTESGVPLVFVRNIRSGSFGDGSAKYVSAKKAKELDAHSIEANDVLVTKMGDPPGDACLYPDDQPKGIITADCIKFRPSRMLPCARFFVIAINSKVIQEQIVGITKGVAQQKVSLSRFSGIGLPLPPIDEQSQIVSEVERRLSIAQESESQIEADLKRSTRLRQSILKRAFEGKLVAQDPNDEPASVLLERIRRRGVPPRCGASTRMKLSSLHHK